ncbi:MAG: mandelate racemase/muconate lactonizing enzyme family protein [Kiritimatiellaeota bacterium]|nr:mandelate racemase/muconate lactonizing enzyme family protein [Kiritimatiellota bacterium]
MRIDRIETFVLKAPLGTERFYSSQGSFHERTSLLVRITTDDGHVGWGESGVSMPVEHVAAYIHDVAALRLLGRDPANTEAIWFELYSSSRDFGRSGTPVDALSGIDVALWDIRGQAAGLPIHALAGGAHRDRVRCYATGLYYRGEDVRDLASAVGQVRDEALGYVARGFTALKGKVGLLPLPQDIKRMEAVREAVGDRFLLMTDANHAYNRHTARRMGQALEALDYYWFEEPLVPEDLEGCAALRRELSIAIATGECEYTRYGYRRLLQADAADIVQADISACGGFSEGLKIHALTAAFCTPLLPHVWGSAVAFAAALQFAAVLEPVPHTAFPQAPENDVLFEYDCNPNPLRDELAGVPFALEGDTLRIPQTPGLGIAIDREALNRYCVAEQSSTRKAGL